MTDPKDPMDPSLESAAQLLRGLPREQPGASVSPAVVEKVRPEAARRKRLMAVLVVVAVLAGLAYAASLLGVLGDAP